MTSSPVALAAKPSGAYTLGMNSGANASTEPEKLRPALHFKIERMNEAQLRLLNQVLAQIEIEELSGRLGDLFDQDQAQGKLQRIPELVRQFRARRHRRAPQGRCVRPQKGN
jgi:hypothetical protein